MGIDGSMLGIARGPQQGDDREYVELEDQFGRTWGCIWDYGKNAQAPVSQLQPVGWPDRLNTPPMYMRFQRRNQTRFMIDTASWIADREFAMEEWRVRVNAEAVAMSAGDQGAALLGSDPYGERGLSTISPALRLRVGPPPLSPTPIRALEAGNKYVRGTSDVMPAWAKPYFLPPAAVLSEFPDAEEEYGDAEDAVHQDENGVIITTVAPEAFADAEDERDESPLAGVGGGETRKRRR